MKTFYIIFISFIAVSLQAQTHTFTGNGGTTDWHTSGNWSANSVPNNTSIVLIPDGFEVTITSASANTQDLTLSGSGTLILANNLSVTEIFSIEDIAVFSFEDGGLSAGTIENNGTMRFLNPEFKTITNTVVNNHSRMDFITSNIINLEGIVAINNMSDGVMDMLANGGLSKANGATATLINDGIVYKYTENGDFGFFYMILDVINNNVLDTFEDSQFLFLSPQASLHNTSTGILTGTGGFDITCPFINEGIVSPGGDQIGELTFVNTFNLDNGIIRIDIADEENFDKIDVVGSSTINGDIQVISNYIPDEFYTIDIINSLFAVDVCNLPQQTVADDDEGTILTFDILCEANKISLEMVDGFIFSVLENNDLNFSITPNPISQKAIITLDSSIIQSSPYIDIYTITGEKVKTIQLDSEATAFIRAALADGLYFAQLVSQGKVLATEKIILK